MFARARGPRIETERLIVRPPGLDDVVSIADLANDADIARMTTRLRYPYRLVDAQAFIEAMVASDPVVEQAFALEHREFGVIGMAGVHPGEDRHGELGYWLGRTFRGRGLATEAVCAILTWAARDWGRRALVSSHFSDNPASGRVLDKAGFLYTGEVRARFSLGRGRDVATRMMVWLA